MNDDFQFQLNVHIILYNMDTTTLLDVNLEPTLMNINVCFFMESLSQVYEIFALKLG